jgi:hypothetical protein
MIAVCTRVRIELPVDVVFDFVSDPRNFPQWNSAVVDVRQISPGAPDGLGAIYWNEDMPIPSILSLQR